MNNKKKALVLFGSPRDNGFTAQLLEKFISGLKNHEIVIIDSYKENVQPCVDCGKCKLEQVCIYDDMDRLDYYFRTADLIIVATPVYNLSVPSPLKAILDRTQRYFNARFNQNINPPIKKFKKAVALITCGSADKQGPQIVISQLKLAFSLINAKLLHTITWYETDTDTQMCEIKPQIKRVIDDINFLDK